MCKIYKNKKKIKIPPHHTTQQEQHDIIVSTTEHYALISLLDYYALLLFQHFIAVALNVALIFFHVILSLLSNPSSIIIARYRGYIYTTLNKEDD